MRERFCLVRPQGDGWELLSPGVGIHVLGPPQHYELAPGVSLGQLEILGRALELKVPEGVRGVVAHPPSAQRRRPVAWGTCLVRVIPDASSEQSAAVPSSDSSAKLLVPSPQTGRFWRRSAPDRPLYAEEGTPLEKGKTLGLLEVMKTFQPVRYQPGAALPDTAVVACFLVEDGQEIAEGQPILEIRPPESC